MNIDLMQVPITVPRQVFGGNAFKALAPMTVKVLLDLLVQFDGDNNGELLPSQCWYVADGRRKPSLCRAIAELTEHGFITATAARGTATTYALTWLQHESQTAPRPAVRLEAPAVSPSLLGAPRQRYVARYARLLQWGWSPDAAREQCDQLAHGEARLTPHRDEFPRRPLTAGPRPIRAGGRES